MHCHLKKLDMWRTAEEKRLFRAAEQYLNGMACRDRKSITTPDQTDASADPPLLAEASMKQFLQREKAEVCQVIRELD